MLVLKRIVTVAVMIYLLLALLFLLVPAVRATVAGMSPEPLPVAQERAFYYTLFFISTVLMGLHLLTENLDSALLRRTVNKHEGKINELKASLYDQQQRGGPAALVVPGSRTVDGRLPVEPARPPAEYLPQSPIQPNDPSLSAPLPPERPPLA